MQRRPKYTNTKVLSRIIIKTLKYGTIALLIWFVAGLLTLLILKEENQLAVQNNRTAQEFNSLSPQERKLITKYLEETEQEELRGSKYLMEIQNVTSIQPAKRFFCGVLLILFCIISLYCFIQYRSHARINHFFLADLPFSQISGWLMFGFCWIAWPCFLISFIRLKLYDCKIAITEHEEVKRVAATELEREFQAKRGECFPKKARQSYISYRTHSRADGIHHAIASTENKLQQEERNLKEYGNSIQRVQKEIGRLKAELRNLRELTCDDKINRQIAHHEWEQIIQMRGVIKAYTTRNNRKERKAKHANTLHIIIAVRLVYSGAMYDLGDYDVSITNNVRYCVTCCRSGKRLNATSTAPLYRYHGEFCFGNRKTAINEYFKEGRIIEMLSLIIDSLHYVNQSDEKRIPDCFRKVKSIDHAKRKLVSERSRNV